MEYLQRDLFSKLLVLWELLEGVLRLAFDRLVFVGRCFTWNGAIWSGGPPFSSLAVSRETFPPFLDNIGRKWALLSAVSLN